jgi:hypothetical protein
MLISVAAAWVFPAQAQEARGTILGRITDSSGAVIPAVQIKIANEETNVAIPVVSNEQGNYSAPFLIPGKYRISAVAEGFKAFVRSGIELRVDDRLEINIAMEIGAVAETVTVTEDTPLLETTNASLGQVIDSRTVADLPIAHGNPYHLIQLAAGVAFTGDPALDRPFEPTHSVAYAMGGTRANRSEITMDGVPNSATANNNEVTAAFVPPADTVAEFKVQTATFDAGVGQSEGGAINVSLKSGTNKLHYTAYYAKMLPELNANLFFSNRIGAPRGDFDYNRYGASANGPVVLPKLFNGKNRSFFMYGYEGIHESRPRGTTLTVPTKEEREGDFSALLALGPQYQIYDPFTRRAIGSGRYQADPFPNNVIAKNRLNPQGLAILSYYPLPTTRGTADFRDNLPMPNEPEDITYYTHVARVDHNISSRQRIFIRGNVYKRDSNYNNWFHNAATGEFFQFLSRGGAFDDVYTLTPTFVMNIRFGYNRFVRTYDSHPDGRGFDITKLGFPKAYNDAIPVAIRRFPYITIQGYAGTVNGQLWRPTETYTLPISFDKVHGSHSFKFGGEWRIYRENQYKFDNVSTGSFDFSTTYTRGPLDNSTAAPMGQGLASMLLGIVTGGYVERRASYAEQSAAWSVFLQDDWKLTRKLTINLGLRYELERPMTERFDRSVRGFDPNVVLPINDAARAAYARNPIPEIPVDSFVVRGGVNFVGADGQPRGLWGADKNNLMPRIGFAYRMAPRTVIRGGYGVFFGFLGTRRGDVLQYGFSERTNLIATSNEVTFDVRLSNPFPTGIRDPIGAAMGAMTYAGQALSFFNTRPLAPYNQRWQMGFQRELPLRFVIDAGYVGNRGTHIETSRNINTQSEQWYSKSPARDQDWINYITRSYPNPYLNLLPNTNRSGTSVARSNLVRPYSQFDSVTTTTNEGYSWYHSAQAGFQRRFSRGWSLQGSYTFSKFMEAITFLNEFDRKPTRVISDMDRPHRFTGSFIVELPFGRKRRWMSQVRGLPGQFVSGWQLQAIYTYQSGPALSWGNIIFEGHLKDVPLPSSQRSVERWFNTQAGFMRDTTKQLSWNVRTFPSRFAGIRGDTMNNWDASLLKNTTLREGMRMQFRFETLNALNHPAFATPNTDPYSTSFGSIVSQRGYSRRVQLQFRLQY